VPASYKQHLVSDARPLQHVASLVAEGPFVLGAQFTIADAYLFVILRLGKQAGLDMTPFPAIVRYMERVEARDAVRASMRAEGLIEA
jgi:glutathione S-transferase